MVFEQEKDDEVERISNLIIKCLKFLLSNLKGNIWWFLHIEIMNIFEIVDTVSRISYLGTCYHSCVLKNMKSVTKSVCGIVF